MVKITHKVNIPKEEFPEFLDKIIIPELTELGIPNSPIGVYESKIRSKNQNGMWGRKVPNSYYILETKDSSPIAHLSMDGQLKITLPEKFQYLNDPNYWTRLMNKFEQLKESKQYDV